MTKKTLNIRLLKAIRQKNNAEVKSMLNNNTPNSVVCQCGTLLHWAAAHGNATITKHLIDLGWEVDDLYDNFTPLKLAVRTRNRATVKVLLRANARVDRIFNEDFTALETVFFVRNFHPGIAREFLRHLRRRISTPEHYANKLIGACCSLYHAVHISGLDLVEFLMAYGRGIDTQGHKLKTALHAAVELGNVEYVEWILNQNADVNIADNRCLNPLYYVYKRYREVKGEIERLAILKMLIDRDVDLMECSPVTGYPQLASVVKYGDDDAIGVLLKSGVDFNAKIERDGKSLVHLLAENDYPGVAKQFEGVHLDLNVLDQRGICPLYIAARRRNISMVDFFLKRGADPNISRRYNPLVATFTGERSMFWKNLSNGCAYLLLRGGADPQISKSTTDAILESLNDDEFHSDKVLMVVSHLALMESMGERILKYTRSQINLDPQLKMHYRSCLKVLKAKVFGSFTLLDLLKITDDEMKIHLRDETFVEKMRRVDCKYRVRMDSYYYEILRRQINELGFAMRLEYQAAVALRRILGGYVPDVVSRLVVAYLDRLDRWQLCRSIVNTPRVKAL